MTVISGCAAPVRAAESDNRSPDTVTGRAANDPSVSIITEKVVSRALFWLKAPTSSFTFKTLSKHYAKQALVG